MGLLNSKQLNIDYYIVFVGREMKSISNNYEKMEEIFKSKKGNNIELIKIIVNKNTGEIMERSIIFHTYPYL